MQKLTWTAKISYGLGAFGKDLVYAIVATGESKLYANILLQKGVI